jgi:inosose dehydratase
LEAKVRPFLVLADANGTDSTRTIYAGRITPNMGLSDEEWEIFAKAANRIARAVKKQTGLRTVFHPHCAGFIETPDEIARLLDMTDPKLIGLVFDTGHYSYGAGGCDTLLSALDRFAERIWYIHYKDCDPKILQRANSGNWDYFEAVRQGVFCELGMGCVNFPEVSAWLRRHDYSGYITVEQDVLPGMGTPKESARRNRDYLLSIGV